MEEHGPPERLPTVAVADLVHRRIERATGPRVEWQGKLEGRVVVQVRDRHADEGQAALSDDGLERREEPARHREDARGFRGGLRERLRASCAGEVVEAHAEDDGPADPLGLPHAPRHALDEPEEDRVDLLARPTRASERTLRPDRAAPAPGAHASR